MVGGEGRRLGLGVPRSVPLSCRHPAAPARTAKLEPARAVQTLHPFPRGLTGQGCVPPGSSVLAPQSFKSRPPRKVSSQDPSKSDSWRVGFGTTAAHKERKVVAGEGRRQSRCVKRAAERPDRRDCEVVLADVVRLVESARTSVARSINTAITATYFEIGRRIVEDEQSGRRRADYGEAVVERLATDLTARFGRGFGRRNLFQMRAFYLACGEIVQTASAQSRRVAGDEKVQKPSALSAARATERTTTFPLPWSHDVRLLAIPDPEARSFYEGEALRGGWTIRHPDDQACCRRVLSAGHSRN